ncbi:centrosome-associated zinc finger protein CP190 [Fopius arisanus]|uniref:Centrosome-associated zinc finger protein CP190 n=1 Tax=Fopius arisanus TaxID=64838 RepID=A0A0C9QRK2_9HYME|nr:PREDICTED: centrosome-associated zinc finger protein CP190 [Fopius arisanus]XP_011300400.1 PREDICTED: centrosome-associated zinc finger protein CP190 [Fopius arisanus]XP_011300401.1 PREDICTED: centrosome-associated zinc finger protein CP190 [Fopius arisanus]XP_011300402.1 PREDICTED: centrosome-associated zinc finger protein CP190 [Fopius arisanus]
MSSNVVKQVQAPGLKQVKVDNWGTFFLQRLQQLYVEEELLDLTIKFPTSDITVQAHRLVITTCTDYFMQLERQQREKEGSFDGILIMPPDMPYECVKSIISFMYTGQLEYWTSEQNALYRTAQKMNMTVLTKLLDAQFNTTNLQSTSSPSPEKSNISFQKPPSPKKSTLSNTPLPGRKLPIWRRKLDPKPDVTPGPSRFDLPDAEDLTLGVFSSFDDITYNTKPIVKATDHSTAQEEPTFNRQTDQDISMKHDTTEDEDEDDPKKWENSDDEWTPNSRSDEATPSKRVRFEIEEKENLEKQENSNPVDNINNHAKIIREVLKKYPHLVKNNKNIRLKIMQKESKTESLPGKTRVSYVVLKSDHLMSSEEKEDKVVLAEGESGPWKCHKCDIDEEYPTYYMYRRHMQDVHEEKFDPRVCEHCGYKATKRNILMHHMYVKHNVPPPKSMSFPKCHTCNYVALSETLMARHHKSHRHGPMSLLNSQSDEVECVQCSETFKDVSELASHEMSTGHGTSVGPVNGEDKGYKCSLCPKVFIKPVNLQVHVETAHKERETEGVSTIPLEPSSEAEALSHVASGIAASLGVGEEGLCQEQEQQIPSEGGYLVNEMVLNSMGQQENYNGHEIEDQQMIMLIDNENYQGDEQQSQGQPQQLEISSNEQLVMQGTDEGMIVYIHGNEDQSARQVYESFQQEVNQETEEIVEEVEEVEEVVEEVEELQEEGPGEQIEEVIQYVEEETEIVEYEGEEPQEGQSMMIIEEEHLEDVSDKQKESRQLAQEWDEDSTDMNES